jgi:hypothetical protein
MIWALDWLRTSADVYPIRRDGECACSHTALTARMCPKAISARLLLADRLRIERDSERKRSSPNMQRNMPILKLTKNGSLADEGNYRAQ